MLQNDLLSIVVEARPNDTVKLISYLDVIVKFQFPFHLYICTLTPELHSEMLTKSVVVAMTYRKYTQMCENNTCDREIYRARAENSEGCMLYICIYTPMEHVLCVA